MSKKHEISLIMESNGSLPDKLGIVMKQSAQHPPDCQTQTGGKVIQDNLGSMRRDIFVISP